MASVRKRTWSPDATGRKVGGKKPGECWEVSWNDGAKRRKKSGFKTKADAEAFAVERQKEVNDGLSRPAGHNMTMAALATEFLAHTSLRAERRVIGPGHLANVTGHFRNYIARLADFTPMLIGKEVKDFNGSLADLTLDRIRPATVEKFRDDLLATGLRTSGARSIITSLSSALDYARRREYVPTNAADKIKIETPRDEKFIRVTPPDIDTIRAVIAQADGAFRLALELSACTGIRAGELRALRYRHIDVGKRMLLIRVALNVRGEEGPPKSVAGVRDIPLSPAMFARLETHRLASANPNKSGLVFPSQSDRAFLPTGSLRDQLDKILKRLGIEAATKDHDDEDAPADRFTWHAIRHYAISSWIAQGMGLKAVQTFAGHADVTTTWNRYGHLFPDEGHWTKIGTATDLTLAASE